MKRFREGLVVGKFSPLHAGHQALIRFAQSQSERVYVINYSNPPFEKCDAAERAHWFSVLFPDVVYVGSDNMDQTAPDNDAAAIDHRRHCVLTLFGELNTTVDAVFTSEDYGDGFAEYLTNWFYQRTDRYHHVEHVLFDKDRIAYPTSGTAIRGQREARDKYLDPVVRASMIPRVAFIGGESSGKTTLARDMTVLYGENVARFVPEYGRWYGDEINGLFRYSDMEHIGMMQVLQEREPAPVVNIQMCDTTPMVTLWYSLAWWNTATYALRKMAERHYDLYVLCAPTIEYEDDGTRSGPEFREQGYQYQRRWVTERGLPFIEVGGNGWLQFMRKSLDWDCYEQGCRTVRRKRHA